MLLPWFSLTTEPGRQGQVSPVTSSQHSLVVWTPAKVNLFLEVLGRRPDGYHEIATLMLAVNLFDTLIFSSDSSGQLTLTCSTSALSCGPENLVLRAATLMQQQRPGQLGVHIHLIKRIPMAAGLAGGSSDAAATLLGLNRFWQLGFSREQLIELAGQLGSDVAFFLDGPLAWCTGRGERVESLSVTRPLDLLLVCPPIGISTAEVYRRVQLPDVKQPGALVRQALSQGDIETLGQSLHNRLQSAAEEVAPVVGELHRRLQQLGAAGTLMSGSGSTLLVLCRDALEARQMTECIRQDIAPMVAGTRVFVVRSCVSGLPR